MSIDPAALRALALENRPELLAAAERVAVRQAETELAKLANKPGYRFGLTYTAVDPRHDAAALSRPPAGNGDDILGVTFGLSLPVWKQKTAAIAAESEANRETAAAELRRLETEIEGSLQDLQGRLPLTWDRLRLLEDLLVQQAEESRNSVQDAYAAGTLNALDLLDAEHVLFSARTAVARARADYLIAVAELERTVAAPLTDEPYSAEGTNR